MDQEQELELVLEQIVQHILTQMKSLVVALLVDHGVAGLLYFLEFSKGQEPVLKQTVAHLQSMKADVEYKAQQHVEPVVKKHLLEKLARLQQ